MSNLPLKIAYQGDTVLMDFTLHEPNGAKLDLDTTSVITWSMSAPADLDAVLIEKTTGSGIEIIDASNGMCRVTIAAGDLDTPGQYVHEIEATFAGGVTYTYGQGPFVVRAAVVPA
jgi:hypothetical protein